MLWRIIVRILLFISPFVLTILSVNDLIVNAVNPPKPTPITLTEISGLVQKLSPKEGKFKDVVEGDVIGLGEQVLTHQDSSTRIAMPDNWAIQMAPLSMITIHNTIQTKCTAYHIGKFTANGIKPGNSLTKLAPL